jgi:hypothetical protein
MQVVLRWLEMMLLNQPQYAARQQQQQVLHTLVVTEGVSSFAEQLPARMVHTSVR